MFGRMENTNQALELEITQEYTGQDKMLTYLAPMWEEALKTDTYATDKPGALLPKRLVGNIVDGSAQGQTDTAMVGVANLGNADNLTGNHFSPGQPVRLRAPGLGLDAGLGGDRRRLGADDLEQRRPRRRHDREDDDGLARGAGELPDAARGRASVRPRATTTAPTRRSGSPQDDFSPVYYNKADSAGLGFDRSPTGSNFVAQYFPTLEQRYGNIETTPENLLDVVPPRAVGPPHAGRQDLLGRAGVPLPDGRRST